jgi:hypothetical protein
VALNDAAAICEVDSFVAAIANYNRSLDDTPYGGGLPPNLDALKAAVVDNLDLMMEIAVETKLHDPERLRTWDQGHAQATVAANELLGKLRGRARREEVMGDTGPSLAASKMHPWVWQPAVTQWDAGHRRDAVHRASVSVFDTELPSKVNRGNMKTLDLVGHVFNVSDPGPGEVRLRIPGYSKGTPEWTDAHKGARDIGLGCVAAIRNITTHSLDEPTQQVALEALAVLSFFARRVDDAVPQWG